MFRKILIANRGEIAVRVIRACREMGIGSVAVFSEADRKSLHVLRADEAYPIGPAPAAESYLKIDRIIEAAKRARADAVHPGYGFLAENPALARACEQHGIALIGPSAASMELLGSKTRARQAMIAAGVPVVPGSAKGVESEEQAAGLAAEFGYPVVVKAAAGGGGKGMRVVHSADELPAALRTAKSEALSAFGDSEVYLEKYLERPRHIEVQVLGDREGNLVYLGERECSIQRRHQKLVEECPSPLLDAEMRRRMGDAAVCAARAGGYYNAGTVEFLVDAQRNFFFLEVNTRLQVEHPVTEMVTGLDLVKLQIAIAAGERLPFTQEEVLACRRGAAIECRIYAEDPDNNFFPSPGVITALHPASGPGVRDDSGVYQGWQVPLEYDPLISKLITWGADRAEAIQRMRRALEEYSIGGIKTTIPFFKRLLHQPDFIAGNLDTGMLQRVIAAQDGAGLADGSELAAMIAAAMFSANAERGPRTAEYKNSNGWKMEGRRDLLRNADLGSRIK